MILCDVWMAWMGIVQYQTHLPSGGKTSETLGKDLLVVNRRKQNLKGQNEIIQSELRCDKFQIKDLLNYKGLC